MRENLNLPESLQKLEDLAYNLWFGWNPDARDLFREIDVDLWRKSGRNPVEVLLQAEASRLEELSHNDEFIYCLEKAAVHFKKEPFFYLDYTCKYVI